MQIKPSSLPTRGADILVLYIHYMVHVDRNSTYLLLLVTAEESLPRAVRRG